MENPWPHRVFCFDWNDKTGAYSLSWQVKVDGDPEPTEEAKWRALYPTYHRIYVTFDKPVEPILSKYRQESLFDISCLHANGEADKTKIFPDVWGYIKGHNVQRAADRRADTSPIPDGMKYWGAAAVSDSLYYTQQLIDVADGRCAAWAFTLQNLILTQGDTSVSLCKLIPDIATLQTLVPAGIKLDENDPKALDADKFWVKDKQVQGQIHSDRLFFKDHGYNLRQGKIFDPSYCIEFDTQLNWENDCIEYIEINYTIVATGEKRRGKLRKSDFKSKNFLMPAN